MTPRARVLAAADAGAALVLLEPVPRAGRRRVPREEVEARAEGERVLREARAEADDMIARARVAASEAAAAAAIEARREAEAELAGRWLALRDAERRRFEGDAGQVVPIAVALAERLLGAALELSPDRIAQLARAVLDEARGARRAVVDAHPLDAAPLRERLEAEGLDGVSLEVRDDGSLARGDLRLHTETGTIDARLAPRFERLAAAVRDALRARPDGR